MKAAHAVPVQHIASLHTLSQQHSPRSRPCYRRTAHPVAPYATPLHHITSQQQCCSLSSLALAVGVCPLSLAAQTVEQDTRVPDDPQPALLTLLAHVLLAAHECSACLHACLWTWNHAWHSRSRLSTEMLRHCARRARPRSGDSGSGFTVPGR
eukprot:3938867-Rhodomonas_salina.1